MSRDLEEIRERQGSELRLAYKGSENMRCGEGRGRGKRRQPQIADLEEPRDGRE